MGHLPPFKRVSAMWKQWGEEEAPRECLRLLWRLYLLKEGLDVSACPWALFRQVMVRELLCPGYCDVADGGFMCSRVLVPRLMTIELEGWCAGC